MQGEPSTPPRTPGGPGHLPTPSSMSSSKRRSGEARPSWPSPKQREPSSAPPTEDDSLTPAMLRVPARPRRSPAFYPYPPGQSVPHTAHFPGSQAHRSASTRHAPQLDSALTPQPPTRTPPHSATFPTQQRGLQAQMGTGPVRVRMSHPYATTSPYYQTREHATNTLRSANPAPHPSGVSRAQIVKALNARAGSYWFHPETADCLLRESFVFEAECPCAMLTRTDIPLPRTTAVAATPLTANSVHSNQPQHSYWPPTPPPGSTMPHPGVSTPRQLLSRRGSLPDANNSPVLVFPLHREYLVTQSTLLRTLLTTSPHLDLAALATSSPPLPEQSPSPSRTVRGARILPTRSGATVAIHVPLPDPASFGVLLHWLYWGDDGALESALNRGLVTWQGVVKNIDYLSLDDSVKRVLGKWWRRWIKTDSGRGRSTETIPDEGSSERVPLPDGENEPTQSWSEVDEGDAGHAEGFVSGPVPLLLGARRP